MFVEVETIGELSIDMYEAEKIEKILLLCARHLKDYEEEVGVDFTKAYKSIAQALCEE